MPYRLSTVVPSMGLQAPRSWRFYTTLAFVVVGFHAALIYSISRSHARRNQSTGVPLGGASMFSEIVSEIGERRGLPLAARPLEPASEDQSTPPARHWNFPPIEIRPAAPGWSPLVTEFTPVTDAEPDPSEVVVPVQHKQPRGARPLRPSTLRMIRWFRPQYREE
jgi:hypothetical protein